MGRSMQTFEKRRRELDKKEKKEAKRLKKEAKKNGNYEPLPEVLIAQEETIPTDKTTSKA